MMVVGSRCGIWRRDLAHPARSVRDVSRGYLLRGLVLEAGSSGLWDILPALHIHQPPNDP